MNVLCLLLSLAVAGSSCIDSLTGVHVTFPGILTFLFVLLLLLLLLLSLTFAGSSCIDSLTGVPVTFPMIQQVPATMAATITAISLLSGPAKSDPAVRELVGVTRVRWVGAESTLSLADNC
jgi:hypothetical protein